MIVNDHPQAWKYYEDGRTYNNALTPNQYSLVETNTEFFTGNQWLNLPNTPAMRGLPKPTFNIIKRVASLFIASLTSSGVTVRFEPLAYYDGTGQLKNSKQMLEGADPDKAVKHKGLDAAVFANAEVANLLEKFKFDYRIREALFDGAQTGDYCAHFYFDPDAMPYGGAFGEHRGEIQMELVDGINVMFGNPNDRNAQRQPYILLVGRDTVENLRWEAERFKANKKIYRSGKSNENSADQLEMEIQPDSETLDFAGIGGKVELPSDDDNGKALYVIMYTKVTREETVKGPDGEDMMEDVYDKDGRPVYMKNKDGFVLDELGQPVRKRRRMKRLVTTVYATKATRTTVIYENVDTGLSRYPIAWGNWEHQKNQYHGRALVTGLIPNQIFINTMFATAMRHMQLMAFPKTVYNADLISSWTNEVGQAIGVHGVQPGQSMGQLASTIQPAEMSNQIFALIDKAMAYTKECLGATDAQMGNVRPDNTSALMVLQTNAEVPLENIRAGLYEWVEDIGAILLDMMGTYYGSRPVVVEQEFEDLVLDQSGAPRFDRATGSVQTKKVSRKVLQEYDFSSFKNIWLNMRVDVGATTYFSEIAMTQTLDNLRKDGTLDLVQYLERVPDKLIPKKQELIEALKKQELESAQAEAVPPMPSVPSGGKGRPIQGGALDADKAKQGLPTMMENAFENLPTVAKKTALQQGAMAMGKR